MSLRQSSGTTIDAYTLAHRLHEGQFDRDGEPHIAHVQRVVSLMPETEPDCLTVAWLHDVLEDTDWTPERLFDVGFDTRVIHALITLTREPDEVYMDYIRRVATRAGEVGRIARIVKEADLLDNLHRCLEAEDPAADRYRNALRVILGSH